MIWILGFAIHMMCVKEAVIQFKLILYLVVCVLEIYILKYMVIGLSTHPHLYNLFQNPTAPNSDWAYPIDMDQKQNKLTYQKTRLLTILLFLLL